MSVNQAARMCASIAQGIEYIGAWTEEDIARASREGMNPGFEDNVLNDGQSGPFPASWNGGGIAWNATATEYPGEALEG